MLKILQVSLQQYVNQELPDFQVLNQFSIPGINPTWPQGNTILTYYGILFAKILFTNFVSILLRDISV